MGFPACPQPEHLLNWIGEWQIHVQKYGAGLPDTHLKSMFMNLRPAIVQKDVVHRKELVTLQDLIDFVMSDLARYNDKEVARIHDQHLNSNLSTGQRNPVASIQDPEQPTPQHTTNDVVAQLVDQLGKMEEKLVAAVKGKGKGKGGQIHRRRRRRPIIPRQRRWQTSQDWPAATRPNIFRMLALRKSRPFQEQT